MWGGVEKRVEKGEKGRERRGRGRERGTLMIKRVGGLWMWWREGGFLSVRLGARAAHQCRTGDGDFRLPYEIQQLLC